MLIFVLVAHFVIFILMLLLATTLLLLMTVRCLVVLGSENSTAILPYVSIGETIGGDFMLRSRIDYLGVQEAQMVTDELGYDEKVSSVWKKKSYSFVGKALERVRLVNRNNTIGNNSFILNEHIFRGGHGEIWKASRVTHNGTMIDHNVSYILKRMNTKDNAHIRYCALREIYFGKLTKGMRRVARFIKYFIVGDDYWLVFRDEGISLQGLLYTMKTYLQPSVLWRKIRTSPAGLQTMKGLLYEVFVSIADLHDAGILHRDIKPSNLLIAADDQLGTAKVVAADFSSAVDDASLVFGLYSSTSSKHSAAARKPRRDSDSIKTGPGRPSILEETLQYAPPEIVLFLSEFRDPHQPDAAPAYDEKYPFSYDSWSLGVMFLEMILGTPDVFSVDQRTFALIHHRLRGQNESEITNALLLAALSEYCIYVPSYADASTGDDGLHSTTSVNRVGHDHSVSASAIVGVLGDGSETLDGPQSLSLSLAPSVSQELPSDIKHEEPDALPVSETSIAPIASAGPTQINIPELAAPTLKLSTSSTSGIGTRKTVSDKQQQQCREDPLNRLKQAILRRDTTLGIGFSDRWGLDLIHRLLAFVPAHRISVIDALSHAYFVGAYVSTMDGSEHPTASDLAAHEEQIIAQNARRNTRTRKTFSLSPAMDSSAAQDLLRGNIADDVASMVATSSHSEHPAGLLATSYDIGTSCGVHIDAERNISDPPSRTPNLDGGSVADKRSNSAAAFLCHLQSTGVIHQSVKLANDKTVCKKAASDAGALVPVSIFESDLPVGSDYVDDFMVDSVTASRSATTLLVPRLASKSLNDDKDLCYAMDIDPMVRQVFVSASTSKTSGAFAQALYSSLSPDINLLLSSPDSYGCSDSDTVSTSSPFCPASGKYSSGDINSTTYSMIDSHNAALGSLVSPRDATETGPVMRADLELAEGRWMYKCPHCHRAVFSSYDTCLQHAIKRRHGTYCLYEPIQTAETETETEIGIDTEVPPPVGLTAMPECLSEHTLMPMDAHSGWCDLRGRRQYMEDTTAADHSTRYNYTYYGVFDGHYGTHAAIFAAQYLRRFIDIEIASLLEMQEQAQESSVAAVKKLSVDLVSRAVRAAFVRLDDAYIRSELQTEAEERGDKTTDWAKTGRVRGSGATATVALFFPQLSLPLEIDGNVQGPKPTPVVTPASVTNPHTSLHSESGYVFVANIGDSHAVLCCGSNGLPLLLTSEHTPYNPSEYERVRRAGGYITGTNTSKLESTSRLDATLRVNGSLAVTRSFGDRAFKTVTMNGVNDGQYDSSNMERDSIVSPVPDITVLNLYLDTLTRHSGYGGERDAFSYQFDIMRKTFDHTRSNTNNSVIGMDNIRSEAVSAKRVQEAACQKKCNQYKQIRNQLLNLTEDYVETEEGTATGVGKGTTHNANFLIVASDGLWDVVPVYTATEMVCEALIGSVLRTVQELEDRHQAQGQTLAPGASYERSFNGSVSVTMERAYHDAAKLLAREAYIRGSSDNIGVCIVDIV